MYFHETKNGNEYMNGVYTESATIGSITSPFIKTSVWNEYSRHEEFFFTLVQISKWFLFLNFKIIFQIFTFVE